MHRSFIHLLEVGWHLYGEDYHRGAFLVRMRGLLREHGVPEETELPDHLTHVLPVLGRLDDARAEALARGYVLPALVKMLDGFGEKRNPYRQLRLSLKTMRLLEAGVWSWRELELERRQYLALM